MITVKEDRQVCVDKHFQHEVTSRDYAAWHLGEKSLRHLSHRNHDHHNQPLVANAWKEGEKILTEYKNLSITLFTF